MMRGDSDLPDLAGASAAAFSCLRRRRFPGQPTGAPGGLEIVAANQAVEVKDLASEVKTRHDAALQGAGIDLVQRDTATGHLGLLESECASNGQRQRLEYGDQADPFGARQVGAKPAARNLGGFHEAFSQTVGQVRGENRSNSHPTLAARGLEFSIEFFTSGRGKNVQPELERVGPIMASDGPADVKNRRAAQAEVGKKDCLATLLERLAG